MKSRTQLFTCVIRQYGTGLYRSCVHLDESGTICLGAYQDEASATRTIARFLEGIETLPQTDARNSEQMILERVREFLQDDLGDALKDDIKPGPAVVQAPLGFGPYLNDGFGMDHRRSC